MMKKVSIKAIVVGLLALLVLDSAGELLLVFTMSGGLDGDAIIAVKQTSAFLVWRSLVTIITLAVAGYFTAALSRGNSYVNAGIVGGIAILLTVLAIASVDMPLWYSVIALVSQLPFTLLGAYLFQQKQNKAAPQ
ncbi:MULTISPECIES: hypothetical protein [Kordiimonas]|jgi:hypothetical protein|uniref:hypothetical protein n=1 Tax=Kordiimonas TaxID=288021 RepID=UPI00257FA46E|nr:hypothetical protein [Kordiimonas sp. UBA4487]